MSDNLIDLQRSQKQIRNPFGFNFTVRWDNKPIVIPGDGKWYTYVGRLADHITRHLKMAVLYRFHDEQKAQLKSAGRDKEANKYSVPADVKNKVHLLITGQDDPELQVDSSSLQEMQELENINFEALKGEIQRIDSVAEIAEVKGERIGNVSHILEQANDEAIKAGHSTKGAGLINPMAEAAPVDSMPTEAISVSDEPSQVVKPEAPVKEESQDTEFPELDGLE